MPEDNNFRRENVKRHFRLKSTTLYLYLNKHRDMKSKGMELWLRLTSALDEGEWSDSHLGRLISEETALLSYCTEECVVSRLGLDHVGKGQISFTSFESSPDSLVFLQIM
jgi:hypothetical protein